jgi:hypothetical protein
VKPPNSGVSAEVVGRRIQGVHYVKLPNSGLSAEVVGRRIQGVH